ncbi:MAG: DUF2845 domain-containing protein [Algiphilus sp.]|uniref:hypothetical protein n=1 Tax=Algiphilus sp. TaxID=1872431 RepID=UPI0032EBDEA7
MQRIVCLGLLAGVVTIASAQPREISSFRFGGQLIQLGDSRAEVASVLGTPNARLTLENRVGAAVGQRWEYWNIGSGYQKYALSVYFSGGRISRLEQEVRR